MININIIDSMLTGSINGEPFGVTYSEELYNKMNALAEKANTCSSVEELNKIIEEFKPLTVEDVKGHTESFSPYLYVDNKTGNYHLKHNNVISSVPLPEALVERIKYSIEKKIDATPLIKAWVRFLRNPKLRTLDKEAQKEWTELVFDWLSLTYVNEDYKNKLVEEKGYSEEIAIKLATVNQVQFTQEGLVRGFKCSTEITKRWEFDKEGNKVQVDMYPVSKDIDPVTGLVTYGKPDKGKNEDRIFQPVCQGQGGRDAFFCSVTGKEAHIIKVGGVHSLKEESMIDWNDDNQCSFGLNLGNILYVKGWESEKTETHNVLFSLEDLRAVTSNSNLRVKSYYVLDCFSGINGSLYHSSTYSKHLDGVWEAYKKEIIEKYGKLVEEQKEKSTKEFNEINSL